MKFTPTEKRAITRAHNIIKEKMVKYTHQFHSPTQTADFLKLRFAGEEREHFDVLFLNSQHELIEVERLFSGTISSASVFPREIVKRSLELNAGAIILAHNHPSGIAEPSEADKKVTTKIVQALDLVDITVLDHFVIGDPRWVSFAERGLI